MPEKRAASVEARFNALLNAAVDAIIEIDAKGTILRFNQAAERMFGYSQEEVLGKNIKMLMPEPYRQAHDGYLQRYQETGEARIIGIGREALAEHKSGRIFPIDLAVGEAQQAEEKSYVGIIRDLSARKQIEEEAEELRNALAHLARVGSLGEMASGIAHEINQPLTAIASYANAAQRLLAADDDNRNECLEALNKIASQAERAGEIIQRLRSFLGKGEQSYEAIDCNQLIHELLALITLEIRNQPFDLILELEENLPQVSADHLQLQQVIHNLIRNAIEAMQQSNSGERIVLRSRALNHGVEISVCDEGPGIDENNTEKLFQPFYTTKPDGMGIGLPLCRTIVRAHGGSLSVANRQPSGADFRMWLPANPGKAS